MSTGPSKNTTYITLENPIGPDYQETLYHLGSKNAKGKITEATAISSIYADFTDRNVKRVDGEQMEYWDNGVSSGCHDVGKILAHPTGNGACDAWARLLRGILRIQGINSATVVAVGGPDFPNGRMLVRNWTFGNGTLPAPYTHNFSDLIDEDGVAGQGNDNPPGAFLNHFIVRINGKYYDPSYGSPVYSSLKAWETGSLAGFTLIAGEDEFAKPDDPNVEEIIHSDVTN